MKRKTISQTEARKLQRRVEQLEGMERERRSAYSAYQPGGVHIGTVAWEGETSTGAAVYTARRLGHAVVAVADGKNRFGLYALPHPAMPVE